MWVRVSTSAQKYRMCTEWATDRDKANLIALGVSWQERRVADWSGARHDPGKVLAPSAGRDLCGMALGPLGRRGDTDKGKAGRTSSLQSTAARRSPGNHDNRGTKLLMQRFGLRERLSILIPQSLLHFLFVSPLSLSLFCSYSILR